MAEITAQMVKVLRDRSGAGIMECKRALSETDGDIDEAELVPVSYTHLTLPTILLV